MGNPKYLLDRKSQGSATPMSIGGAEFYQTLQRRVEALSKGQKVVALIGAGGASCVLGIGLALLLTSGASPSSPAPSGPSVYQPKAEQSGPTVTRSGTILSADPSVFMQGTHQLLDDEGELLALLESREIDLSFLEGMAVEVEGVVSRTVEGDVELIRVGKVMFR